MKIKTNWELLISQAQKKVRLARWEIAGLDLIIFILIIAGYDQLVDSFGPQYMSSYLKAAGIEGGVIVLSRLFSRFQTSYMKNALYLALALSCYANTTSEWIKVTGEQYLTDAVFEKLGMYQIIRGLAVSGFIPYFIWILTKSRIACLGDVEKSDSEITALIKQKEKSETIREQGRRQRIRQALKKLGINLDEVEDLEFEAAKHGIMQAA